MGTGHGFCQKKTTLDYSDVVVQCSTHGQPKMPNWSIVAFSRLLCYIQMVLLGLDIKTLNSGGGAGKFIQSQTKSLHC